MNPAYLLTILLTSEFSIFMFFFKQLFPSDHASSTTSSIHTAQRRATAMPPAWRSWRMAPSTRQHPRRLRQLKLGMSGGGVVINLLQFPKKSDRNERKKKTYPCDHVNIIIENQDNI